jgi:hypothetical protein
MNNSKYTVAEVYQIDGSGGYLDRTTVWELKAIIMLMKTRVRYICNARYIASHEDDLEICLLFSLHFLDCCHL